MTTDVTGVAFGEPPALYTNFTPTKNNVTLFDAYSSLLLLLLLCAVSTNNNSPGGTTYIKVLSYTYGISWPNLSDQRGLIVRDN